MTTAASTLMPSDDPDDQLLGMSPGHASFLIMLLIIVIGIFIYRSRQGRTMRPL